MICNKDCCQLKQDSEPKLQIYDKVCEYCDLVSDRVLLFYEWIQGQHYGYQEGLDDVLL